MKVTDIDAITGEVIEREFTANELAQRKIDADFNTKAEAEQEAKATARAALLTRLGITADEAALLLG